jgi:hypothetical protein
MRVVISRDRMGVPARRRRLGDRVTAPGTTVRERRQLRHMMNRRVGRRLALREGRKLIADGLRQGSYQPRAKWLFEMSSEGLKRDVHVLTGRTARSTFATTYALVEFGGVEIAVVLAVLALLEPTSQLLRKASSEREGFIVHQPLPEHGQGRPKHLFGSLAARHRALDDGFEEGGV